MQLEIINKLFLELSQVATAETEKEMLYKAALKWIRNTPCDAKGLACIADEALRRSELR